MTEWVAVSASGCLLSFLCSTEKKHRDRKKKKKERKKGSKGETEKIKGREIRRQEIHVGGSNM